MNFLACRALYSNRLRTYQTVKPSNRGPFENNMVQTVKPRRFENQLLQSKPSNRSSLKIIWSKPWDIYLLFKPQTVCPLNKLLCIVLCGKDMLPSCEKTLSSL